MTSSVVSRFRATLASLGGIIMGSFSLSLLLHSDSFAISFFIIWLVVFVLMFLWSHGLTWFFRAFDKSADRNLFDSEIILDSSLHNYLYGLMLVPLLFIYLKMQVFGLKTRVLVLFLSVTLPFLIPAGRVLVGCIRHQLSISKRIEFFIGFGLAGILLLSGFLIRLNLIPRGLPYPANWDEPFTLATAIRMFKTGNLNPEFFHYPSFTIYLQWLGTQVSYSLMFIKNLILTKDEITIGSNPDLTYFWYMKHPLFWFVGRLIHASWSCCTAFLLFIIGKRLRNIWTGLMAMGFTILNSVYAEASCWTTVDTVVASNILLWAFCLIMVGTTSGKKSKSGWFFMTAIAAGLTVSAKYNAALIIPVSLLALVWDSELRSQLKSTKQAVVIFVFLSVGTFLLTSPYAIFDFWKFVEEMVLEYHHYTRWGHPGATIVGFKNKFLFDFQFLKETFGMGGAGPFVLLLSPVAAMAWDRWVRKEKTYIPLLLFFGVLYQLYMGKMLVTFTRNLTLLVPFMAISMAYLLGEISWFISYKLFPKPLNSMAGHVLGLTLFIFLFFKPVTKSFAEFRGLHRYGNETRSLLLEDLQKKLDEEGNSGKIWLVQESRIHPDDLNRFLKNEHEFVKAEEALRRLKQTKEKPAYLVTAILGNYPPSIIEANNELLSLGEIKIEKGPKNAPVLSDTVSSDPNVFAIHLK